MNGKWNNGKGARTHRGRPSLTGNSSTSQRIPVNHVLRTMWHLLKFPPCPGDDFVGHGTQYCEYLCTMVLQAPRLPHCSSISQWSFYVFESHVLWELQRFMFSRKGLFCHLYIISLPSHSRPPVRPRHPLTRPPNVSRGVVSWQSPYRTPAAHINSRPQGQQRNIGEQTKAKAGK